MDIHRKIRDVVAEAVRCEGDPGEDRPLSEEDLLRALQRRGIVEDVMEQLSFPNAVRVFTAFSASVLLCFSSTVNEVQLLDDHTS